MNEDKLLDSLMRHEGCRLNAYRDSYGTLTIGYGRNLETLHITLQQATLWLNDDMHAAVTEAQKFQEYALLDTDARRNAFIEMVFNLGATRFGNFRHMLAAIRAQDWQTVYFEALNSSWANQVGRRAKELAEMLRSSQFPS